MSGETYWEMFPHAIELTVAQARFKAQSRVSAFLLDLTTSEAKLRKGKENRR